MKLLERLKGLRTTRDAENRLSEREVARRIASGETLTAAEEKDINEAVLDGSLNVDRLEATAHAYTQLDQLLHRAGLAKRQAVERVGASKAASAELDEIQRKIPLLKHTIQRGAYAPVQFEGIRREIVAFCREHEDLLGPVDAEALVAAAIAGPVTLPAAASTKQIDRLRVVANGSNHQP